MASTINAALTNGLIQTADTSGILQLQTAGTTALTINGSQNIGIGVTPSSWLAGSQAIQNSSGSFWQYNGANIYVGQNYYLNSSTQRIYSTTAAASEYQQGGGVHRWYTTPSGTAGNIITLNQVMTLDASGNLGIGTTTPAYKLQVVGSFAATTKSFVIEHPTKPGYSLRYGSLEGPENGVYVRGKLTGKNTIELPDYWTKLVDPDSITVSLTPIGKHQKLYVENIENNIVTIANDNLFSKSINCFYLVQAERADVEKLIVEII
jgi:hypothetical protein